MSHIVEKIYFFTHENYIKRKENVNTIYFSILYNNYKKFYDIYEFKS